MQLGEVSKISSGGTPNRANQDYWNGTIPWITTSLINFNVINKAEEKITEHGMKNSSAKLFPKETVLMAMYGQGKTRGQVAILDIEATTNQACAAIISDQELLRPKFLFQNLSKRYLEIRELSNQGGQENLSGAIVKAININLPTIEEQDRLAAFLTAIDNRIGTQNKIIEELKLFKSTLTRKIFDQNVNFNDINGNEYSRWEVKKLGEVCKVKRGASPRPIADSKWFDKESKVGWVRISDVTKSSKYLYKTEQYLSNEGIAKSRMVPSGSMIMSICATIGKPIYTKFDVCIHDGFVVFEDLTLVKEYLYYYLDHIQLNWYKYGQPGTQVNLNSDIVNNETIPVPNLQEQKNIAYCLSSVDAKLDLEQSILQKYLSQKEGLMKNIFC